MNRLIMKNKILFFFVMVLSVIISIGSVGIAVLLQLIIDTAVSNEYNNFWNLALISALYLVVYGLFLYFYSYFTKKIICKICNELRRNIYNGVQRRIPKDFAKLNTADYLSIITNDIKNIEDNYLQPIIQLAQNIIIFLATLFLLLSYSVLITCVMAICMIIMYIVPSFLGRALQNSQGKYSNEISKYTSKLKDLLSGYEVIRSFQITNKMRIEHDEKNNDLTDSKLGVDNLLALSESVSTVLAAITQVVVIFMSAYLVMRGQLTVGVLMALVQLSSTFINPVLMIMQSFPKIKGVKPIISKIEKISNYQSNEFSGTKPAKFVSQIKLEGVTFKYEESRPVIMNISTTFEKGKKYGITGASGCGKSTLMRLLMAEYNSYNGEIYLDKHNIRDLQLNDYASLFSIIHQQVYLFDRDIKMNISLGNDYSSEEWGYALSVSGVNLFLDKLPDGLDSMVGENGCNLSGGQRQRIAVARAIIHKAPILILDEGTSAIDMQTAFDIESQLLKIKDLTLITITHNLNEELLCLYDQIIFMSDGTITHAAPYRELLDFPPFKTFCTLHEKSND